MKLIQGIISSECKFKHCHRTFSSKIKLNYGDTKQSLNKMPSPKGLPFVGTLFSLIMAGGSSNLHNYIDKRHKEFGPIFKELIGPVDATFVSDPQIMRKIYGMEGKYPIHILPEAWVIYNEMYGSKRGLYFMNGEEWSRYRHILNKILLTNYRNDEFESIQNDVIDDWINDWKQYIDTNIEVLEPQFYKLSLSYVIATLIGSSYLKHKNDFKSSIVNLSTYVHSIFEESCKLNLIPAKFAVRLNLRPWRRFAVAVSSALEQGESIVNQMKDISTDDGLLKKLMNENVPPDVVVRIIIDLILAASDTTAFTTQWSVYLLSKHIDVQQSLNKDPHNKTLLRGIIKETLRLYPAAPFITRILPEDVILGGYHVPAGQLLIMSLYSSGRNEKYFPEPDRFWPERWERNSDNEHKAVIEPIASQPFAMGLRSCVGRKLAESQMMMTLTKVASNFHFKSLGETEMVLHFVPVPKTPIRIHLSRCT